jgi:hypothetical protein
MVNRQGLVPVASKAPDLTSRGSYVVLYPVAFLLRESLFVTRQMSLSYGFETISSITGDNVTLHLS